MATPTWVNELVDEVIKDEGCDKTPPVKFIRRKYGYYVSGTCYKNKIVITKGKHAKKWKVKYVLLHELAHWIRPWGEHHSPKFWDKAFELYRRYKLPIRKVKKLEEVYRVEAGKAYKRNLKQLRQP